MVDLLRGNVRRGVLAANTGRQALFSFVPVGAVLSPQTTLSPELGNLLLIPIRLEQFEPCLSFRLDTLGVPE